MTLLIENRIEGKVIKFANAEIDEGDVELSNIITHSTWGGGGGVTQPQSDGYGPPASLIYHPVLE